MYQVVVTTCLSKNQNKRSFFDTFVKKVDFISSGPNLKGRYK